MPLRHRVVAPVPRAAFEVRSHGCRHSDRPVICPSPGLDEQHPEIGVLAQTRREDATSGPGAHNDVVELGHGRKRWPAVAGILRAMAAATDSASYRASNRPNTLRKPTKRADRARRRHLLKHRLFKWLWELGLRAPTFDGRQARWIVLGKRLSLERAWYVVAVYGKPIPPAWRWGLSAAFRTCYPRRWRVRSAST